MSALSELYRTNPKLACEKALRDTKPLHWTARMERINELLGTHGVEAIRGTRQNGYWGDVVAQYCNTGDTYGTTVIMIRGTPPRFIVSSFGDWVERNADRHGLV